MSDAPWSRLIRFVDDNGTETFGEPQVTDEKDFAARAASNDLWAVEYKGRSPVSGLTRGDKVHVKEVRDILRPSDVPIIRCIGLNYIKHRHNEDVPIPKVAQDGTVDYEGELAFVIGKSGKNIAKKDALSHIAGYLACNDVSARAWQRDPKKAGGVPQWCFSKGFDKFAPLSPMLVSPSVVGDASSLRLRTLVNGEERQNEGTDDLLFGVEAIVEFLSQGTTLEAGTVVLTGTPSGVAMGMKEPKYLNDGDVVEVTISGLGSVKNKMVFE
ncbi:hypothetical protein ACHAO2_002687 [Verticillium nonalfalfae]